MKCSNCGNEMVESKAGHLCISCGHIEPSTAAPAVNSTIATGKDGHDQMRNGDPASKDPASVPVLHDDAAPASDTAATDPPVSDAPASDDATPPPPPVAGAPWEAADTKSDTASEPAETDKPAEDSKPANIEGDKPATPEVDLNAIEQAVAAVEKSAPADGEAAATDQPQDSSAPVEVSSGSDDAAKAAQAAADALAALSGTVTPAVAKPEDSDKPADDTNDKPADEETKSDEEDRPHKSRKRLRHERHGMKPAEEGEAEPKAEEPAVEEAKPDDAEKPEEAKPEEAPSDGKDADEAASEAEATSEPSAESETETTSTEEEKPVEDAAETEPEAGSEEAKPEEPIETETEGAKPEEPTSLEEASSDDTKSEDEPKSDEPEEPKSDEVTEPKSEDGADEPKPADAEKTDEPKSDDIEKAEANKAGDSAEPSAATRNYGPDAATSPEAAIPDAGPAEAEDPAPTETPAADAPAPADIPATTDTATPPADATPSAPPAEAAPAATDPAAPAAPAVTDPASVPAAADVPAAATPPATDLAPASAPATPAAVASNAPAGDKPPLQPATHPRPATPLLIGGVIGGVLLFVILAALAYFYVLAPRLALAGYLQKVASSKTSSFVASVTTAEGADHSALKLTGTMDTTQADKFKLDATVTGEVSTAKTAKSTSTPGTVNARVTMASGATFFKFDALGSLSSLMTAKVTNDWYKLDSSSSSSAAKCVGDSKRIAALLSKGFSNSIPVKNTKFAGMDLVGGQKMMHYTGVIDSDKFQAAVDQANKSLSADCQIKLDAASKTSSTAYEIWRGWSSDRLQFTTSDPAAKSSSSWTVDSTGYGKATSIAAPADAKDGTQAYLDIKGVSVLGEATTGAPAVTPLAQAPAATSSADGNTQRQADLAQYAAAYRAAAKKGFYPVNPPAVSVSALDPTTGQAYVVSKAAPTAVGQIQYRLGGICAGPSKKPGATGSHYLALYTMLEGAPAPYCIDVK